MQEFIVRKFDNSAIEVLSTHDGGRYVRYNTGDVVFFMYDKVVAYLTHTGKYWETKDFSKIHNNIYQLISGSIFKNEI